MLSEFPDRVRSLEQTFPEIRKGGGYKVTSWQTDKYNCVAWAANDSSKEWWPRPFSHWPPGVQREETQEAFIAAYETLGYEICSSPDDEPDYEKIAIFLDGSNTPTHAARSLGHGKWTSKIGSNYDIAHELSGLNGTLYGSPKIFMRRPL